MAERLTSQRVRDGARCRRLVWLRVNERDAPELASSAAATAALERGRRVCVRAREHVPGGTLINFPPYMEELRLSATQLSLRERPPAIYEACFLEEDVFVVVDILERSGAGWALIEVKASTEVKEAHLLDVAVQLHVLRRARVPVVRAEVMHLERSCRHPELSKLFRRSDVTARVAPIAARLPDEFAAQRDMLAGPMPAATLGRQCREPEQCPFLGRCWPNPPPNSIETLHRYGQLAARLDPAWRTIADIPDGVELPPPAQRQRRAITENRMVVEPGLSAALEALEPPIAFLDFETVTLAIPSWRGCRPYDQVPVQMSCHLELPQEGGGRRYEHFSWLAGGGGDPRRQVAERTLEACRHARTVLAWNATFERERLEELAASLPELAGRLAELKSRLQDMLALVRDHLYHPAFEGSFSLKKVVPALLPDERYDELAIRDGESARLALERLLLDEELSTTHSAALRRELLAYCKKDTWVMVRLLEKLRQLAQERS
ncbi:MAG: DUF2779 domain-containing protein [Myxococcales bacterium]|nr:DUF2779 domain-containing protein [Myxococcales bacterium]